MANRYISSLPITNVSGATTADVVPSADCVVSGDASDACPLHQPSTAVNRGCADGAIAFADRDCLAIGPAFDVVLPGVLSLEAEDLPGAVDRRQLAELPDIPRSGTPGNTSASRSAEGRFITVSAAAMMNDEAGPTALASASNARRQDSATSRWSMQPHRFHLRSSGSSQKGGNSSYRAGSQMLEKRSATKGMADHRAICPATVSLATVDSA